MLKYLIIYVVVVHSFVLKGQNSYYELALKTNNVDSSIHYLEKSIEQTKLNKDTAQLIEETCLLARNFVAKSIYSRSVKLVEEALSYPFVDKHRIYKARLFLELAATYRHEGSYTESLKNYHKASDLFEELSAWHFLVNCQVQMAEYYRRIRKHKIATEYIDRSFKDYDKYYLNDTTLLIYIHNRAAAIANESNPNVDVSIQHSRKALNFAIASGNKNAQATSLNELGFTYKNLQMIDSSEFFYKKAEDIWFSIGAFREALNATNNRAMLYRHNDYKIDSVAPLYNWMINTVEEKNIDYLLSDAYAYLNDCALEGGDSAMAYKYLQKYHTTIVDDLRKHHNAEVVNITERYESKKAKEEAKRVSAELSDSLTTLKKKEAESKWMVAFLFILVILITVILFLFVKINKTNKELETRNDEKDVLIQEIHHRVKNNLQFIGSLINMQKNSSSDDKEITSLNDASRRIRAMALVHEMLYNHKELNGISIKKYLEELVLLLDQLVNTEEIPIDFKISIEDDKFNVSDSIALGMITSELVSNSIKHAFYGVEHPEINIRLKKVNDLILFQMKDNGVGQEDVSKERTSLGLRLIDIFSRQLKGKYSIQTNNGYDYKLQFAIK